MLNKSKTTNISKEHYNKAYRYWRMGELKLPPAYRYCASKLVANNGEKLHIYPALSAYNSLLWRGESE